MANLVLDCNRVTVKNPPNLKVRVSRTDSVHILVPVTGPRGPAGPPGGGGSGGSGSPRYTYLSPLELPDNTRTVFTTPDEYVVGTLAVYLNGILEFHISQDTNHTFSFETAPHSDDTIKVDYNTLP